MWRRLIVINWVMAICRQKERTAGGARALALMRAPSAGAGWCGVREAAGEPKKSRTERLGKEEEGWTEFC